MFHYRTTALPLNQSGRFNLLFVIALAFCGLATPATAQTLINDGATHTVLYDSNNVPQDFTIPFGPTFIVLEVRGAEGGRAAPGCISEGGSGAITRASFEVGSGSTQLAPGGQVRFIIGERGEDDNVGSDTAGGGGGGSGVLYKGPSASNWTLLMAAGGGGGAYQGESLWFCRDSHNGMDANTGEDGSDGGNFPNTSGSNGCSGSGYWDEAGNGGGDHACGVVSNNEGQPGYPSGGAGGVTGFSNGGWGYGGGGGAHPVYGGGGGGGGYSGGGPGEVQYHGGGGGSYVSSWAQVEVITTSAATGDGFGNYRCVATLGGADCAHATWIGEGTFASSTEGNSNGLTGFCSPEVQPSEWFKFSNPEPYAIEVTVETSDTPFLVNTSIGIFTECGLGAQSIACDNGASTVTWIMQAGETDQIRIGAFSSFPPAGGTNYTMGVSYTTAPITNNTCGTAMPLDLGLHIERNIGATTSGSLPCGPTTNSNAWYVFENTLSEEEHIEISVTPMGTGDELGLQARSSCGGASLACAPATHATSTIFLIMPPESSRSFRVGSVFGNDTAYQIEIKSVDDVIAPGAPTGITADYQAGGFDLDWNDAPEIDFATFRVYRGTTPGFTPGPGNLVQEVTASTWTDAGAGPYDTYYKLTAVDRDGNESLVGTPGSVSDVGANTVPTQTVLREAYPNPFNPSTRLSFDLAKPARARLNIFDISGRLVRSLVDEQLVAGRHEVVWNGRNEVGALVSSGVYLYRLEADNVVQMKRMMLLK